METLKTAPNLELESNSDDPLARLSPPPTPDYNEGATHVLDVIHRLLAAHREIEQIWQERRLKLHQKLALLLFQQDVKQVKIGKIFQVKDQASFFSGP